KKYGKFDVYDPNKIVGKTDAEPFRSDYISIVKDGDAGRIRLLPKNTMILSTMGALIAKDPFKIDFLYYMLNAINDLSRERNGSIIPHIYFKDYGQNIYNLPSIPEQSKISSLFTYLDSLITLHQRKLSSLKNLKNRLLDRMFCDEKSQFPSIRFTEFTNAWEQDTAKNLFIPYRVKNSSNMNLVSYSVTNKDGFVNQNEYFDDGGKAVFADKKNSLIVSINTFAYNPSRINVGSLALYKHSEMGLVSPIYEVFQINNNNNPDFFLLWFRSEAFKNIVSTNSNKSVRDTLNLSQFESESVNFPNFAEQSKISSLFTHLDSLITLHQRKLLSLKNLKSRLLDRMFCDEKSQFPSIRFKEFTNAWEQWKVGDLITERIEFTKESNEFPLMAFVANEGVVAKGERYDRSSLVRDIYNKIYKVTKYGDFIYSSNNLDRGSIGANKYGNACISPVYSIFKCTNSSDHNFIKNILSRHSFVNKLLKYRQGVVYGQLKIHESIFLNINLNSPSILEQNKIGKIFYNLDSLITLHQRKLLSLKNLKSRLLDRMFCDEKSQFPSIRFKEFTNTWEQDTAKNLFIPYRVKNSSNMNLVSYSVTNKDGFVNQNEYFDDGGKAVFADKKNSLIVSINTFAYNPSRINVGSLALYKHSEMGLVSPIYEVFQINNNNNPDFFLLWFRSEAFKNIVSTNSNKSVRDTLNLSQFESESVNFPNFAEQSKISSLFTHLDSLITLHQRKRITRTV
ncbi:restriction endonuclease subunit S, partial [Mycoplasmopsis bovis]|uniref:restriction endonuclease subunit S n=2 Tax=Mycoplasmopsis bovis TaxID=28903 RepID=UPI003D2C936B